jgi:hypothetical protein
MIKQRGICVYDIHTPHEDKLLWKNILEFIKDFSPTVFLLGGDNLNMDAVDHWLHDKGFKRPLEGRRIKKDYQYYINKIHNPLMKILPRNCKKHWLKGNHENWIEMAIDRNPQGEGYWEIKKNIPLHNWKVYEYGKVVKIGKLRFIHGEYFTKYHAAKTIDVYERSIICGHAHTFQAHTKIVPVENEPHACYSVPCACKINPEYRKNKPNSWVNGFGVFYLMDDGKFNFYPVIALNGHFISPNGKYY